MTSNEEYASSSSYDDAVLKRPSKRYRLLSDTEKSSSSSSSDMVIGSTVRRRRIGSDSEPEVEDDIHEDFDVNWRIPLGNQTKMRVSNTPGINTCQLEILACTEPHSFYFLFVTDEIFQIIANQTNTYAGQTISGQRSYRLDQWHETNSNEIKRFFGLIIWMGLVRLPKIDLYWSKNQGYKQTFPSTVMSRNRFELLLRFVHFSNKEEHDPDNRLSKIIHIVNHLNSNFKKYYNPDETLCMGESLVPLRGRIVFRQYIKQKRTKYGIKVFKLCGGPGYTYSFQIYTGKDENVNRISGNKSSEIVISLCNDIIGKGRTICTDNWYASVDLAEKLITMHTDLVGDLRKNRRSNPEQLVIARQNENSVKVLKLEDNRRDALMPSPKHSAEIASGQTECCSYEEPKMVAEYNSGKSSVDLSDQMAAYCSPLRKTVKWYKKLAMELLLNTCIVNSMVLFKQATRKNISIPDFRMKLAMYLVQCSDDKVSVSSSNCVLKKPRHELKKKPGHARNVRRFCRGCYEKNSKLLGRINAKNCTRKVVTYCADCTGSPFLCLECFNVSHRKMHR